MRPLKAKYSLFSVIAVVLLTLGACGGGSDSGSPLAQSAGSEPTAGSQPGAEPTTVPSSGSTSSSITACELLPQAEAEAVVGVPLALIPASDDYRCSYDGGIVDGEILGALLSILPTQATVEDLNTVRNVLDPATVETIDGLGEAAYYWDAGAVHSVNFVQNGVLVVITVNEVADGDDVRAAEMQIARAASARL